MKYLKIFFVMAIAAVLCTSCEKDDSNIELLDSFEHIILKPDAAGAMYANDVRIFDFSSGVSSEREELIHAWFEDYGTSADAGEVKVNNYTFVPAAPPPPGVGFYYNGESAGKIFTNGSTLRWSIAGTPAVAGFAHTDNRPFPSGGSFTLPPVINVNNSFTLTHDPVAGADSIIYYLRCTEGQIHKMAPGTSTSVSFSANEMDDLCRGSDYQVVFMVVPVIVNHAVYNNKKYYFVKQLKVIGQSKTAR